MSQLPDVGSVVQLDTHTVGQCRHCPADINGSDLGEAINHYLSHGYRILHLGEETRFDNVGNRWHITTAILGK